MLPGRGRSGPLSRAGSAPPAGPDQDAGLWTVPNLVSGLRIAAIPLFLWLLLGRDEPGPAAVLLGVIAWTDQLDGWLARRLGQVSEMGKFLDPLADRLVIATSVIGGLIAGVVPAWLGWPLLVRETVIGSVVLYLLFRFRLKVAVRRFGKIATGLVFAAVPFYYMSHTGLFPYLWSWMGAAFGIAGLALYAVVSWQYVGDARRALRRSRREAGTDRSD